MDMQFAEMAAEPFVGLNVHRLIAKEQNLVLRKGLMQLFDLAVAKWIGKRDAFNQGTDARRNRRDLDGFIAHGKTFDIIRNIGKSRWNSDALCDGYSSDSI